MADEKKNVMVGDTKEMTEEEGKVIKFKAVIDSVKELAREKLLKGDKRYEGRFTILDYFRLHGLQDLVYEVYKDTLRIVNLVEKQIQVGLDDEEKAELNDKVPDLINYAAMIPALYQFYENKVG